MPSAKSRQRIDYSFRFFYIIMYPISPYSCIRFSRKKMHPCPSHTACNLVILLNTERFVQSFNSPTVYCLDFVNGTLCHYCFTLSKILLSRTRNNTVVYFDFNKLKWSLKIMKMPVDTSYNLHPS